MTIWTYPYNSIQPERRTCTQIPNMRGLYWVFGACAEAILKGHYGKDFVTTRLLPSVRAQTDLEDFATEKPRLRHIPGTASDVRVAHQKPGSAVAAPPAVASIADKRARKASQGSASSSSAQAVEDAD